MPALPKVNRDVVEKGGRSLAERNIAMLRHGQVEHVFHTEESWRQHLDDVVQRARAEHGEEWYEERQRQQAKRARLRRR